MALASALSTETRPRLVGDGEPEFSTCLALEKPYRLVWDVNGYYRALGISSDATRLQIRGAYQRLEGWNSVRLTYIVTQLLDPQTRALYDAVPLGFILRDYWVDTEIRRATLQKNISSLATGEKSYEEIYEHKDIDSQDSVDKNAWSGQDGDSIPDQPPSKEDTGWSYYLWDADDDPSVAEVMDWWRSALAVEFGIRGKVLKLAIGLCGDQGFQYQWRVEQVGYRKVIFLGDDPMDVLVAADVPLEWKLNFLRGLARGCASESV